MKRDGGEWFSAIVASGCVGIAMAVVVCGVVAVGSHVYAVQAGPFRNAAYAAGALLGAGTAVHFLRSFWIGELEPRDIWRSVGKAFIGFGAD